MLPDKLSVDEQLTSLRSGNPSLYLIIGGDGVLSARIYHICFNDHVHLVEINIWLVHRSTVTIYYAEYYLAGVR